MHSQPKLGIGSDPKPCEARCSVGWHIAERELLLDRARVPYEDLGFVRADLLHRPARVLRAISEQTVQIPAREAHARLPTFAGIAQPF